MPKKVQKLLTFFQQKILAHLILGALEDLTNHWLMSSLSFEQLGPEVQLNFLFAQTCLSEYLVSWHSKVPWHSQSAEFDSAMQGDLEIVM